MIDDGPKIGWGLIAWSTPRVRRCNVPACDKIITSGYVRADNKDASAPGFIAICTDCWFKIQCGVDPDPDATVPAWEEERRAQANPDT